MQNIFQKHKSRLIILSGILIAAGIFIAPKSAEAAACVVPTPNYGTVTNTVNVPTTASYVVWTRMAIPDSANNSYMLEIDGNDCVNVVGGSASVTTSPGLTATPPTGTINWTWVDYQNGSTSSRIIKTLSAGNHTFKMIGTKVNVAVDRVILAGPDNPACNSSMVTGNTCVASDTTDPTVSITSPANGAQVTGTVNIAATASDNGGTISKVDFFINGSSTALCSDNLTPFTCSWNTTALAGGSSNTILARAYDANGNSSSATITVTKQATVTRKPGDANGDNIVDTKDAIVLSLNWGKTGMTFAQGNFNETGAVDTQDAIILSLNWGK